MKKDQEKQGFLISPWPQKPGFVVAVKAKNVLEAAIMIISLKDTGFPKNKDVDVYSILVWEYDILGRKGRYLYSSSISDGYGRNIPDDLDINKIAKKGAQPINVRVSVVYELSDDGLRITIVAE
jgi:hypothetical protein